jgi:uncharacterized protein (DUF1778 family)
MAKTRIKKVLQKHSKKPLQKSGKEDTTSLSIRLTHRERELLTEAAELRGESPTRFIKSSACTTAAHLMNTSRKTTVNFEALAHKIATLLFKDSEFEYRIKALTGQKVKSTEGHFVNEVGSYEALTYGQLDDEIDEWYGSAVFGSVPESWRSVDDESSESPIIRDGRKPMRREDFFVLRRALNLGGTEFMKQVLQEGLKSYFSGEPVDEPIDPRTIG